MSAERMMASCRRPADEDVAPSTTTSAAGGGVVATSSRKIQFPWRLHMLLDEGNDHIVSWLPSGRGFQIHRKDDFTEQYVFLLRCLSLILDVCCSLVLTASCVVPILITDHHPHRIMPKYFSSNKYKSFQRNLNLWGFETAQKGVICHKFFVRNKPDLCNQMTRLKIKGTGHSKRNKKRSSHLLAPVRAEVPSSAPSIMTPLMDSVLRLAEKSGEESRVDRDLSLVKAAKGLQQDPEQQRDHSIAAAALLQCKTGQNLSLNAVQGKGESKACDVSFTQDESKSGGSIHYLSTESASATDHFDMFSRILGLNANRRPVPSIFNQSADEVGAILGLLGSNHIAPPPPPPPPLLNLIASTGLLGGADSPQNVPTQSLLNILQETLSGRSFNEPSSLAAVAAWSEQQK
jgi:hypothetical protein